MREYVYSAQGCSIVDPSTRMKVRLLLGEVWDAGDPLVLALPHLFVDVPPVVRRTVAQVERVVVESAVAVPGVKRQVKRA